MLEVCKTATVDVAGEHLHSDDVHDDRDTVSDISRDTVYPLILVTDTVAKVFVLRFLLKDRNRITESFTYIQ